MAEASNRLPSGGRIDRDKPLRFTFNGREYSGYEGDTLASALLAHGVSLVARSFKYHRPRGIMGAGVEEPSALVELLGDNQSGNQPITMVRLRDGLKARSVNCWPSPGFDLMAVNQLFSGLLPAAFYYKTFMWPTWHLFEPFIRRAAGLAEAPKETAENLHYETRHGHCDILVVGAGPAGLMAALTAARSGARVMIADEGPEPGGSLLSSRGTIGEEPATDWASGIVHELDAMQNVTRLRDAVVWAYREHNLLMVTERSPAPDHVFQRTWRVRAARVIVAAGAIERTLVFPGNDRPGCMLASAARAYVNRYAVKPGSRAVIFTNNNSAYEASRDLNDAGIEVAAIVDVRHEVPGKVQGLTPGTPCVSGHVIAGTAGGRRIRSVTAEPRNGGARGQIECDLLLMSGGWSPTVHLYSQARGSLKFDDQTAAFIPDAPGQQAVCAGAAAGVFDLPSVLADGAEKGAQTARELGFFAEPAEAPRVEQIPPYSIEAFWPNGRVPPGAKAFVDVQNDVTLSDVHLSMREGFAAVEHVKRYTTAGMGIDQGKTGNINVVGAIAQHAGVAMEDIGTTTFRPPYLPVDFGASGGLRKESVFLPYRHTPITEWNIQQGATMYEAGARWQRPGLFPRPGESFQETVNRESRTVRENVGVYDGSPLGKFEIKGRDALRFLNMLYTNAFDTLEAGSGRYGLMLSDDGLIIDDGV
ncbi:MAG: 2Fe-2S iron-sulfur cluster-binding protein, partial [Pseudomonadota bacterium]